MKKQILSLENSIYLGLWALLFVAPVLVEWVVAQGDAGQPFLWADILLTWRQLLPFGLIFAVHNGLLAPLLVYRGRRGAYFSLVAALFAVFVAYQCTQRPLLPGRHDHHHADRRPPLRPGEAHLSAPLPPDGIPFPRPDHRPPYMLGHHEFLTTLVLLLMLGMNLGVKLYFKQRDDEKRLAELERRSLEQQLERLRYQLNPHFFMNTLNNIHSLVDIDPELAQEAIIELSRLLRFVLYEADKPQVPLDRDLAFLGHYVRLMRLRFTDQVRIDVSLPDQIPPASVPPLLLQTFIENAFKHGISYRHPSFIEVRIAAARGRLLFACANSKHPTAGSGAQGGVGLNNVRQRLDLLFPGDYSLTLHDEAERYTVRLDIPLNPSSPTP